MRLQSSQSDHGAVHCYIAIYWCIILDLRPVIDVCNSSRILRSSSSDNCEHCHEATALCSHTMSEVFGGATCPPQQVP